MMKIGHSMSSFIMKKRKLDLPHLLISFVTVLLLTTNTAL